MPSIKVFTKTEFDYATLEHRLRELAFLNSGVRIVLRDERGAEPQGPELYYEGGRRGVRRLPRPRQDRRCTARRSSIRGERDGITVEVALQWNDGYHETMLCFTNNIPQRDGGTHLAGFRAALTRTLNKYAEESGIAKRDKVDADRRGHARGPDLRALGQDARPEVLLADQGQAGHLRGPAGGRT